MGAGGFDPETYAATSVTLLGEASSQLAKLAAETLLQSTLSAEDQQAAVATFRHSLLECFSSEAASVCQACMQSARSLEGGGQLSWLHENAGADSASQSAQSPTDRVRAALLVECRAAFQLLWPSAAGSDQSGLVPEDISAEVEEMPGWSLIDAALKD